ncbi:MAG: hypothetical protein Ct9H300mP19_03860 [Dehalococcoidia bacterium]|nr:MAG: hypothetical protein Ct9H300mP19_03860 [Dehalococcoidia bacterium]
MPAGFGDAGIPVGAMLTGELHDDLTLLQLAFAYDQTNNWNSLVPPIYHNFMIALAEVRTHLDLPRV